jgi:hypothetical protein
MSEVPAGWYPHPYHQGQDLYWDGSGWTADSRPSALPSTPSVPAGSSAPAVIPAPGLPAAAARPTQPARPRAAWLAFTLIPILGVLVIGAVLILVFRSSSAQSTVAKALSATLARGSSDVTVSGSASVEGITAPVTGSGQFNFTRNIGVETLKVSVVGQTIRETVINDNQNIYLNLGGLISKVLPGKSWLSMNLSGSEKSVGLGTGSSSGSGASNPGAELNILGHGENRVTALGPSVIHGVPVQGYLVLVSMAQIKKEVTDPHLPEWVRQAAQAIRDERLGYKVFIGGSGTVYRLTTGLTERVGGQLTDEFFSTDFTHLGTTVHVTPPPADRVGSYTAFVKAAKAIQSKELN